MTIGVRVVPFGVKLSIVAVLFAFSACDCDTGVREILPHLGPTDDAIDFGQVAVGDSVVQTIRLTALTAADVGIAVVLEDNEAGAFSLPAEQNDGVRGNGHLDLRLTFKPPAAEVYVATLDIVSDDPEVGRARRRVLLSGDGKRAELTVEPESLELSATGCLQTATSPLCSDEKAVTLKNTGLVNLLLEKIELVNPSGGAVVANLTLAKPVTASRLRPGETLQVPLRWKPAPDQAPTDPGADDRMSLRIHSNDADRPVWDVPVSVRATVNAPPQACVKVTGVTRREYQYQDGQLKTVTKEVPSDEWWADTAPGILQVRPGYSVAVSANIDGDSPCTFDPEGDVLTPAWTVSVPEKSSARMRSSNKAESSVEVDATGEYEVKLLVADALGLTAEATLPLNAEPRDDLFVQLSWEDEQQVDLDLHLLVDAGPIDGGLDGYSQASLFCEQDTFFGNPSPNLFDSLKTRDDPRLLRDDQGSAGRLESISLEEVPDGSRFRVAVHYFGGAGAASPTLNVRLRGRSFDPITPMDAEMTTQNETWFGALIDFPVGAEPSVTETDVWTENDVFSGVGVCD